MTKFSKLYTKIVRNPKDVEFDELDKILKKYNFKRRQPSKGSSHYTYFHDKIDDIVTVPKDKPIKSIYVKIAIAAIEKLRKEDK
ncbi:hypothetical protein Dtox_0157 [Desulfofarcimen acetoxidans DSM 771]|uniref:YcfA family protein n=1 Tax=Desulfofarcimen acetoxidans (strain ATCC 49208 / DSM 771 / KCTC 5769 / VKM B-1644 / 5575) TaxID=485916 RepID=C8W2V7_DESAS|nr:type II toxin-antitoxin system HicA family toxin [Desulfofarcimen acetoxidans]ACV61113.1 hypothetical protein Dtox_0157 [Desulfofarcimen acetoxidans DSM 771]